MSFGSRLKEERLRLKLSQPAMAAACGVSRGSQINYEAEDNSPGWDYLAKAFGLGVDVHYVLGGVRSAGHQVTESPRAYSLPERERGLLKSFGVLDERAKRAIESVIEALRVVKGDL